jgi:pyruvate/2-oxoglutarate dehydrogenase complex dihydrolipoamide acyltransferase (E2) component
VLRDVTAHEGDVVPVGWTIAVIAEAGVAGGARLPLAGFAISRTSGAGRRPEPSQSATGSKACRPGIAARSATLPAILDEILGREHCARTLAS